MEFTAAWEKEEHAKRFGRAITLQNEFKFLLEFRPSLAARCLNFVSNVAQGSVISVLDIGCAAGDYYAYLTCQRASRKLKYEGVDISRVAIAAANRYYQTDRFQVIDGDEDLEAKTGDIVLSVDVLQHHPMPIDNLVQILKCAKQYLVVKLRTRDNGETVLDPERSCQRIFGEWVPFIVINTSELYRSILSSVPVPVRISSFKEYRMFAGSGPRFLPKELYLEESGTAVTTLIIEKRDPGQQNEISEYHYTSSESIALLRMFRWRIGHYAGKLGLDRIAAGYLRERITDISGVLKYGALTATKRIDTKDLVG